MYRSPPFPLPRHPTARQLAAWGTGLLLAAGLSAAVVHGWRISRHFPAAPFPQPSRLYARVPELALGQPCSLRDVAAQLESQGYAAAPPTPDAAGASRGTFRLAPRADTLSVGLRRFPTPAGWAGGEPLTVEVRAGRVARLRLGGRTVVRAALEPALLASYHGPAGEERWPVRVEDLPDHVVQSVLAAEDDGFFRHSGLSASAIARAAWIDLRGREVLQGGSTITQQLVKNLYLPRRRNLLRKTKEALLAEIVELRHDKRAILEAYLNSIYWGRSGQQNLVGLGAAARAWFGKPPEELDLAQAVTLAAMIRAPADYSPPAHAAALLARRNRLLGRMADLGWIGRDQARRTQAEPLGTAARQLAARPCAPWFADLAAQEARQRFGVADLAGGGYLLFSTLDAGEQRRAEAALTAELADLGDRQRQGRAGARRPEPAPPGRRSRQEGPEQEQPGQEQPGQEQRGLEAALVSVDPRDGGILAYVGGRDYRQSQFDRLAQAHRQLGSAFKPVVYAAAFDLGVATPATLLDDSPVLVRTGGAFWEPQNYDRTFRGWVTARGALEQSLNVPTVRLALEVGLRRIANLAGAMGLGTPPAAVPAMALGAVEASPLQVARMYSTLATLGLRPTLHGLDTVRDRNGILLAGEELPPPRRVLAAPTAYLVTSLLQGAVDHGTASAVRRQGLADPVAGKTGTTSDRRDSWFAGYSADRVTVVWLGYDDDSGTRLSGATAAVPLWGRFMLAVRPAGGFHGFAPPPGMLDDGTATGTDLGAVAPAGLQLPAGTRAWTQGAPGAVPASASGLPPGLSAGGEHGGVILIRLHEAVDPDRKGGAP